MAQTDCAPHSNLKCPFSGTTTYHFIAESEDGCWKARHGVRLISSVSAVQTDLKRDSGPRKGLCYVTIRSMPQRNQPPWASPWRISVRGLEVMIILTFCFFMVSRKFTALSWDPPSLKNTMRQHWKEREGKKLIHVWVRTTGMQRSVQTWNICL